MSEMDPMTIENALEKKCKNHSWLIWILFLTACPSMFISSHLVSYVFLGGNPSFFCNIPELVEANWTKEQKREISSPEMDKRSCAHYAWNYSLMKDFDFDEALRYCNDREKPDLIKCKSYIYDEEIVHQTIVSEWDLVCDNLPLRSTAQGSVAMGKLFGAVSIGLLSDRFGRKKMFVFSCILFMIASPSAAIVKSYIMFIVFRLVIGFTGAGIYETAYTILMEHTVKRYRTYLTNIFYISFSLGLVQLSLLAYFTNSWRQLQLAISALMIVLVIHCWFLPESPRWLIISGKLKKVSNTMEGEWTFVPQDPDQHSQIVLEDYFKLFSTLELTKRTLVCNYLWFMGNLYHFVITISGSKLEVNQYLYVVLNGMAEVPGYTLPLLYLTYFGRKSSAMVLCIVAGIAMLLTTVIPQGWAIVCVSLVGRVLLTSAYGIIMFYTSELFPTECRNTAMGSCITAAQFGPLLAPYLVDILGKKIWWLPTVLTGSLALLGAFLLIFVPETRDTQLPDTIKEMRSRSMKEIIEITS